MGCGSSKRLLKDVAADFDDLLDQPNNYSNLYTLQRTVANFFDDLCGDYEPDSEDYHKAADLVYKEFEKVLKRNEINPRSTHWSSVLHNIASMNAYQVDGNGDANGRAIIEHALQQIRDGTSNRHGRSRNR